MGFVREIEEGDDKSSGIESLSCGVTEGQNIRSCELFWSGMLETRQLGLAFMPL